MNFREYLTEIFNDPVPYKWITKKSDVWEAIFNINDKEIAVFIQTIGTPSIGFSVDGKMNLTGGGNVFLIFSTVLKIIEEWIVSQNPEKFIFTGTSKRKSLYIKLAKTLAKKYSYILNIRPMNDSIYIEFLKK